MRWPDPVASGAFAVYAVDDTEFSTPLTARDPVTGDTLSTIEVRYRDHGLHQWLTPARAITL